MSTLTKAPGVISEAGSYFIGVEEVKEYLGCKDSKAYDIIRALKRELVEDGRLTPAYPKGKVPKKYFLERCMIEE